METRQNDHDFTIYKRGPGFGTEFLTFNTNPGHNPETGEPYLDPNKREWFSNEQFRRAVAHSIDKNAIIDDHHSGLAYPQWAHIPPAAGDFHNPDVPKSNTTPAKQNEILDSIGWVDTNGDGIREDNDGNTIQFTLATNSNDHHPREHRQTHTEQPPGNRHPSRLSTTRLQRSDHPDNRHPQLGSRNHRLHHKPRTPRNISFWHSTGDSHLWNPGQLRPATEWEAESTIFTPLPVKKPTTTNA